MTELEEWQKDWNILPAIPKDKAPAVKIGKYYLEDGETINEQSYFHRKYPREYLESYEDFNLLTICGQISNNLTILDFDLLEELKYNINKEEIAHIIDKIYNNIPKGITTLMVLTTSGGIHVYFNITDECPKRTIDIPCNIDNIKQMDICGEGGYVIIPPSKVIKDGTEGVYRYINKGTPIAKVSLATFMKIVERCTDDTKIMETKAKTTTKVESKPKNSEVLIIDGRDFSTCCEPTKKLLTGEWDIRNCHKATGEQVRYYWRMLLLDVYHETGLRKEQFKPFAKKYIKGYKADRYNAQPINYTHKKFKPKRLSELFPEYDLSKHVELPAYAEIGEYLIKKYNLITMTDSEHLYTKRGNIYIPIDDSDIENEYLEDEDEEEIYKKNYHSELANQMVMTGMKRIGGLKNDIDTHIRLKTRFNPKRFCFDDWVINFKNGYYNLEVAKYIPSEETRKIFPYEIPREFKDLELKKDCPLIRKYIQEWLGENNRITVDDMFEFVAYTMTMGYDLDTAFYIYGKTRAGKSQFLRLLQHLVGKENRTSVSLYLLQKDIFALWALRFKLLNVVAESKRVSIKENDTLKELIGNEFITSRKLYRGYFEFRNTTKLWHGGNNFPFLEGSLRYDPAFYRRWIVINFPKQWSPSDDNYKRNITKELVNNESEMEGFITQCIIAGIRLAKNGGFRPELYEATEEVWRSESDILYKFRKEHCIVEHDEGIITSEFHRDFIKWAIQNKINRLSPPQIRKLMEADGFYTEQPNEDRREYYMGIGWKPEESPKEHKTEKLNRFTR